MEYKVPIYHLISKYMYEQKQNQWKILSTLLNAQTNCCLKLGLQNVDSYTGGKWESHGIEQC